MGSKKFQAAYQKVSGYETTGGKNTVQNLHLDKGNWVNGHNAGTAYGISAETLDRVYYGHMDKNNHHVSAEKFADGTQNPYYHPYDATIGQQHIGKAEINKLTPEQAMNISDHNYWQVIGGDQIHDKIATLLYDSAFHNGNENAIAQVQANLASANLYNGEISGRMNPATRAAINNADPSVLYNFLIDARIEGYQGSSSPYKTSYVNRILQGFPKEPLTPEQQEKYDHLPTLKDFQGYLNTLLGSHPIKEDGIWGASTKDAIASVGGKIPGHAMSPILQKNHLDWHENQTQSVQNTNPLAADQAISTPEVTTQSTGAADNTSASSLISGEAFASVSTSNGTSAATGTDNLSSSGVSSASGI